MPLYAIDPLQFTSATSAQLGVWTDSVTHFTVTATEARNALTGAARNNPTQIAAKLTELLQTKLDTVIALSALPIGDPDKTTNPNRPDLFWDGLGNLIGRSVKVTISVVNGQYQLTCERTN